MKHELTATLAASEVKTYAVPGVLYGQQLEDWFMDRTAWVRYAAKTAGAVRPSAGILCLCATCSAFDPHSIQVTATPRSSSDFDSFEQEMVLLSASNMAYARLYSLPVSRGSRALDHVLYVLEDWRVERLMRSEVEARSERRCVLGPPTREGPGIRSEYGGMPFRWLRPDLH